MILINNKEIKHSNHLSSYIRNNVIDTIIDQHNKIEEVYKVKYLINDKIRFLNIFRNYINTKSTFILYVNSNNINVDFDIDRLDKFINYVSNNKMDRLSNEYQLLRYGFINSEERNKYGLTIEKFILRYGKEIGEQKYYEHSERQKLKSKRSLQYWIDNGQTVKEAKISLKEYQSGHIIKHMSNKDDTYISEYNNRNTHWRTEYYIHRGFSEEQASQMISEMKKKSSMFCKEYYTNKGYSIEESIELSRDYWYKHCYNNGLNISKESIKLFSPIINELNKIENICIYYGDKENNKNEYFLYDKDNKKYYFYDLTILYHDIKLIIEYNGEKFHPNKEKLSVDEWNNWRCLFNEHLDADIKHKMDSDKKELAIQNGFKYLEVWSSDVIEENTNKIKYFINDIYDKRI